MPPAPGQAQPAEGGLDRITVVGHATWLMMQAPTHKHLFLADLEWLVLPPVILGQFRLWRRGDVPVGFASWAYLSEEAEARVRSGVRRLTGSRGSGCG